MLQKNQLIERLKQGDEQLLQEIYRENRLPFIHWIMKQYTCELEDAKEVFQLSVVTLYDNIVNGKLQSLSSSLNTYLFSIGKNKMREWKRSQQKIDYQQNEFLFNHIGEAETTNQKEQLFSKVDEGLKKIGEPCKTLLELVYYNRLSMQLISTKMNYKNADTAKNAKYKCLQRLKKQMNLSLNVQ